MHERRDVPFDRRRVMGTWSVLVPVLAFLGSVAGLYVFYWVIRLAVVTGLTMPGVDASSKPGKKRPGIPLANELIARVTPR
jgi:hypothetical protein